MVLFIWDKSELCGIINQKAAIAKSKFAEGREGFCMVYQSDIYLVPVSKVRTFCYMLIGNLIYLSSCE